MRLFLALNPPPELRQRLGELADIAHARCGGRRVPDASLHLTLAFLGEQDEARAEELTRWVGGLSVTPGLWRAERWGSFRGPRILWAGGQRSDPALATLHDRLWAALERLGIAGRPTTRFVPHVTLVRGAQRLSTEGLPAFRLDWRYDRLTLLHSVRDARGARYRPLAQSRG